MIHLTALLSQWKIDENRRPWGIDLKGICWKIFQWLARVLKEKKIIRSFPGISHDIQWHVMWLLNHHREAKDNHHKCPKWLSHQSIKWVARYDAATIPMSHTCPIKSDMSLLKNPMKHILSMFPWNLYDIKYPINISDLDTLRYPLKICH